MRLPTVVLSEAVGDNALYEGLSGWERFAGDGGFLGLFFVAVLTLVICIGIPYFAGWRFGLYDYDPKEAKPSTILRGLTVALWILGVGGLAAALFLGAPKYVEALDEANSARAGDGIRTAERIEPHTFTSIGLEESRKLGRNEPIEVAVVGPDGVTRTIGVRAQWDRYERAHKLIALQGVEGLVAIDEPLTVTVEEQYPWTVRAELEERYGLSAEEAVWKELQLPNAEPQSFISFGTSNIVIPRGGNYETFRATLIWDGGYRLVTADGAAEARELPVVR